MPDNFADRLCDAVVSKNSRAIAGIDPRPDILPSSLRRALDHRGSAAEAILSFAKGTIDAVEPYVCGVKVQNAFFEALGIKGVSAYSAILRHARDRGLIVIGDVKRGDIGSTASAYAAGHLLPGADLEADAVTISAYLGHDGVAPFIDRCAEHGKGLFVLLRTSNPSAGQIQDVGREGLTVWERLATLVSEWGSGLIGSSGYSSVGGVAGATYPEEAVRVRRLAPSALLLMPGYGAQGAKARDVVSCLDQKGLGAVVASSRGIMHAFRKPDGSESDDWQAAAAGAAAAMRDDINECLEATVGRGGNLS